MVQSVLLYKADSISNWPSGDTDAGRAKAIEIYKAVNITNLSATEISFYFSDGTVSGTASGTFFGKFSSALFNTKPTNLYDLYANSNFMATATVTGEKSTSGLDREIYSFAEAINFSTVLDAIMQTSLASNVSVYSGNDIGYTGRQATSGSAFPSYSGNDVFVIGGLKAQYSDVFYGGTGTDTVILPGKYADYNMTLGSVWNEATQKGDLPGNVFTDKLGVYSTVQLNQVEYAQFADKTIKLSDLSTVTSPVLTTKAAIYMGSTDVVTTANSGTTIYGNSGTEIVTLSNYGGSTLPVPFSEYINSITLDQNVDQVNLFLPSSLYQFQQAGNTIKVFDITGKTLIVSAPVQGDANGTLLSFPDGTASAKLVAGVMTIGGAVVSAPTPGFVSPTCRVALRTDP